MDIDMYSTVSEASLKCGKTTARLRQLLKCNRLNGIKKGKAWLVSNRSLEAYINHTKREPEIYR